MSRADPATLVALGAYVRERRKILGLTQTQLGQRLGWLQERISILEHGRYGLPSLPALTLLAEALGSEPADLLRAIGYHDGVGARGERGQRLLRSTEIILDGAGKTATPPAS